jgi:hypothetical protein
LLLSLGIFQNLLPSLEIFQNLLPSLEILSIFWQKKITGIKLKKLDEYLNVIGNWLPTMQPGMIVNIMMHDGYKIQFWLPVSIRKWLNC